MIDMYDWKLSNITVEKLRDMEEVQIETVSTIKERIYLDNISLDGMEKLIGEIETHLIEKLKS